MNDNTDRYLESIKTVLADYSDTQNKSIFFVIFTNFIGSVKNIGRLIKYWLSDEDQDNYKIGEQESNFINLIYTLIHFGINRSTPDFFTELNKITLNNEFSTHQKLERLNYVIALAIYMQDHNRSMSYLQIHILRKAYYHWVRSLSDNQETKFKFHIYKQSKDNSTLEFDRQGKDIALKKFNLFKKLFFWQASIAIFFTSIVQGLIPAVLSAASNGGLLYSIALIGIPSIIMDYILFNSSVTNLVKDIWYDRLLKDNDGNYIWASIPIFVLSLCAGITYGTISYIASLTAYQGILLALFPTVATGFLLNIAVLFAIVSACYSFVCLSSLFFNSMIDIVRKGIYVEFKEFININFINRFFEEDSVFVLNLVISLGKAVLLMGLFVGAIYLTILKTALLYSMVLELFHIPMLSLGLVLAAASSSLIFTFKVYNFALDTLLRLPWIIIDFAEYLINSFYNPIVLYEAIKRSVLFVVLGLFNFMSAKGSADGMVDATKEPACNPILEPFSIDPNNPAIQFMSTLTAGLEDSAANWQETVEVVPLFNITESLVVNELGTVNLLRMR